ncbi:hypothetical protein [Egicoccus sp. AB-alg6-2]|uniref:hypothetical protein n=1 Tax=Egicoccus sp. AB-alg6-2 TaxID=3242692 RepID=UPI00359ED467
MPATVSLVVAAVALLTLPHATADRDRPAPVLAGPLAMGLVDTVDAVEALEAADAAEPGDAGGSATPVGPPATSTEVFAVVEGLDLRLPADEVVALGFHEAAASAALPLSPVGTWEQTEDPNGFDPADIASTDGPEFLVLPSRQRAQHPTSAADVVLEETERVVAPVDGVVVAVADYHLYGKVTDTLVHIRPTDRPDLRVAVLHLDGASVAEGDQVLAGETVIAPAARLLDFPSQIDRFVGAALPHVHVEVTRNEVAA